MSHSDQQLSDLRHSAAHLLAAAVMELWPDTKRTIGPAIDDGFYFDFLFSSPISDSDLPKIEERMRSIVKSWDGFTRHELSVEDARKEYPNNPFKLELIEEFSAKGETLSFYKSGGYWDLCRGGHCDHPKDVLTHFRLTKIAGAYWRGDSKQPMLTRIYGTAFFTKEELETYLFQQEEAKKRDHRKLGKELELYFIDEMIGKGLVMWLPKGTILRDQVERFAKEEEEAAGYQRVTTPHIAKEELFLTSGHLPYYQDSMYPPMVMDDGTYYLKAMNCPHHHRIFQHRPRSYKELPLRFAEYGTCYRNELSGTLAGLLRVRGLSMNDAHLYCTRDQVKEEFAGVLRLTMKYFETFGLKDYWFRLSKWDPKHTEKYINEPENWTYTEDVLRDVLKELDVKFVEVEDEAAFYGPKVDVQFTSVIGREETMSTIQLDFAAKKRFGLSYVDESGKENGEVFVIHRAPLSVHERFLAFLIEHFAGSFPLWLAPTQVVIIPISADQHGYCKEIESILRLNRIRAEFWSESESMQNKIRKAEAEKVPYMAVIGKREAANQQISVRARGNLNRGVWEVNTWIEELRSKIESKSLSV